VKIDLHIHTKERSSCGRASEIDQVRASIDAGLDAIVLTDHGRLAPVERISQLNEVYAPFRIFGGIEMGVDGEDFVILGIHDARLEADEWSYPQLYTFTRERDGFLMIAHPYRYHPDIELDIEQYPPDAIEVYSPHTPPEEADRIFDLASRLGIHTLSNSDAHTTDFLGKYYNVLDRSPVDERELIDILRKGQFTRIVRNIEGTTKASTTT